MGVYKVFFKKSVWKDFKSIPDKDLTKIRHPSYRPESSLHFSGENPAKWDMISESVNWTMKDAQNSYLH